MRFAKMHGLGNDFVFINGFEETLPADKNLFAKKICDRNLGIGADGVIILYPSNKADFRFEIINSDGSFAEMCGNGMRCAAIFARNEGIVDKDELKVETAAGILKPCIIDYAKGIVCVDMGEPRLNAQDIPTTLPGDPVLEATLQVGGKRLAVTAVSMGNPHCVVFVDDLDIFPVTKIGPQIETHPAFPEKTNVEFVQILAKNKIKMRVWERGCGVTLACGTGASAAAVAAFLNGFTDRKVEVELALGSLMLEYREEDGHVLMEGPAVTSFVGEYNLR
ncbi:MAG: diaminopimelate epimerase [Firmicutes bacterium]|nr:diaminopimelate epimerase [Bacillota bacterium]